MDQDKAALCAQMSNPDLQDFESLSEIAWDDYYKIFKQQDAYPELK